MANANITGIKPAYRRLITDMSITLGQVLNFEASKPGSFQVVNVRGQVNSAYAPAQVQDFLDWLLAVSPSWTIHSMLTDPGQEDLCIEDFDINKYMSVYSDSSFVKHLARLLHQGTITMLMNVVPAPDNTYKLCIEILQRHHVKVLSFVSGTVVKDIADYVLTDDSLISIDSSQEMHIEPYQIAAVTQHNNRTMGHARNLNNISVLCGALIGRNGSVENVSPLMQSLTQISNVVMVNLVEYGFKHTAQLMLLQALNEAILQFTSRHAVMNNFVAEVSYRITVNFSFLDDERNYTAVMPWNQITVKIVPVIATAEEDTEHMLAQERTDEPFIDEV